LEAKKNKTLKHSATKPQPKPFTAEIAGGGQRCAGKAKAGIGFSWQKIVAGREDFYD